MFRELQRGPLQAVLCQTRCYARCTALGASLISVVGWSSASCASPSFDVAPSKVVYLEALSLAATVAAHKPRRGREREVERAARAVTGARPEREPG